MSAVLNSDLAVKGWMLPGLPPPFQRPLSDLETGTYHVGLTSPATAEQQFWTFVAALRRYYGWPPA